MRKNLVYLTKWCLKYTLVVILIVLLIRYTLRISLTIQTTQIRVSKQKSNVETFHRRLANRSIVSNDHQDPHSINVDFSFNLLDSIDDGQHSSSDRAGYVYVKNFKSFLQSPYFYSDREFNQTSRPLNMCPYLPDNLSNQFFPYYFRYLEFFATF